MLIFFGEGRSGLSDFLVQVIDCTVNSPSERDSFWIEFEKTDLIYVYTNLQEKYLKRRRSII